MEKLFQHLPTNRHNPRLWFERLLIFSEPDEAHVVRRIDFHRGLNLVWAKEPAEGSAEGTRAAGHGVGKTSLCLLLRFCLGESSKAVMELRKELFAEFAKGGVIAVLHVDDQPFTLRRYFNAHKEGAAYSGDDVTGIWNHATERNDRAFLEMLADEMMRYVSPRNIPETGHAIEWKHVLAWISRDQGSRFKSFFAWREGEGTGLQHSRQYLPIVMRSVLGLLAQDEFRLMSQQAELKHDLELAKKKTEELLQEPALIRRRIESNLRAKGKLPDDLLIRTDDLFADSVEQHIKRENKSAADRLAILEDKQAEADQTLANWRAQLNLVQNDYAEANAEYELAAAAKRGDEEAFLAIGAQLKKLKQLAGYCEEGDLLFSQCQHIQVKINTLERASIRDARDKKNLLRAMDDSVNRAARVLLRMNGLKAKIEKMKPLEKSLEDAQKKAQITRRTVEIEANTWLYLQEELERWERISGSSQAQAAIDASREKGVQIEREVERIRTQLAVLQDKKSSRAVALDQLTNDLTHQLLSDGAVGTFDPHDENRPFRLSMRGGEAYQVLEVLLGDVACLLDSARSESALPGLLIHDCPREADMSTGLYENFLSLIARLQREQYVNSELPFQYIITTTTPPPAVLQGSPPVCLMLDPSSDKDLLFGSRFTGERQAELR
ncbi:hypothetical protein AGMMS50256_35720 [Betaproteobacteria bacterium]|nr:hypothetical protein AGMMS50256_35720 [Betaproteobacteria bacterium]